MKEALLYKKIDDNRVKCQLCAHHCTIANGSKGLCQVRENQDGILYSLVYGRTISRNVDPIEKKPLYHFYPGSRSFSIATPGCNFHCDWCQNWEISQLPGNRHRIIGEQLSPQEIVAEADSADCRSIAYTYTEPTVFFEYAYDTARLARDAGIANVFVSNGFMSAEMLELFHPWLDAANIDLKAFRDQTYRTYVGARLPPVLDSLKRLSFYGVWLEVTTLIIPGINDDSQELEDLVDFIVRELGEETPWHVSRFFPGYKMKATPPTPPETLQQAVEIGRRGGLHNIYTGNLNEDTVTICPGCGVEVVRRSGFGVRSNRIIAEQRCPDCGEFIAGVGLAGEEFR